MISKDLQNLDSLKGEGRRRENPKETLSQLRKLRLKLKSQLQDRVERGLVVGQTTSVAQKRAELDGCLLVLILDSSPLVWTHFC